MSPLNPSLKWFGRITWLGIVVNLCFALPALFAPDVLGAMLGAPAVTEFSYVWVGNAGMLLLQACLFYVPAAHDPLRYRVYAWLTVFARLGASTFWIWQDVRWSLAGPMRTFFLTDLCFGVVLGVLLQRGLPVEYRIGLVNVRRFFGMLGEAVAAPFRTRTRQVTTAVVVVVVGAVGFVLWDNLARARPDVTYDDPEEAFKYEAVGLGMTSRIPYYVWAVMPEVFPDLFPDPERGWASLGLLYEPARDLPVGFALRHIGYPSVEPNCALCHTGSYRTSPGGPVRLMPGAPAHTLDLQRFQWVLYDAASDPRFSPDTLMPRITARFDLSATEKAVYRYVILPVAKQSLQQQAVAYAWQKSRPTQGRGRTDTFNPTKINVFRMPDDHTIGTVDLPAIWNQRPREGMWLHWDGNNNKIRERNYAAAMAVGATPFSVLPAHFDTVTTYVLDLAPPSFPFPIDTARAARGAAVFEQTCAGCHGFGREQVGQVTSILEIGTDRHRLDSFTPELVSRFHAFDEPPFVFDAYRKTDGYSNLPIDGTWARAPYLHNGSVPTLWDLLQPPENRPVSFYKGYDLYDPVNMGFVGSGPEAGAAGFLLDTRVPGNGNAGHRYGTTLTDEAKRDLIEYLKTY